tara:strand:+ start:333 stop:782 length:450 start_codon:yes stop_codon:yes gene_type:complete
MAKKRGRFFKKKGEEGLVTSLFKGAVNKAKLAIGGGGAKKTTTSKPKKGLSKTQKLQKKSDQQARKQAIRSDAAGKNLGARTRFVGRAEARSYLPDDLRAKPKSRWTARDKKRARKAELQGMHKTTKRVNDRKSGNIARNIKSRLPGGY